MPYKLIFTDEEKENMRNSRGIGHTSWSLEDLKSVKKKIKQFSLTKTNECCCYCGRNQHGEAQLDIDIEHILPKSVFPKYMFTIRNLSTSCKRCNMSIKGSKINFLTDDPNKLPKRIFRSKYYKFIHPHLDKYSSHIEIFIIQIGTKKIVKYSILNGSEKGSYTYEYFKLNELEINNLDKVQGGKGRPYIINPEIAEMMERILP